MNFKFRGQLEHNSVQLDKVANQLPSLDSYVIPMNFMIIDLRVLARIYLCISLI